MIGLALVAFSFLFPCWEYRRVENRPALKTVDYQFILVPPKYHTEPMEIDYGRMLTEIVVVIIVGAG